MSTSSDNHHRTGFGSLPSQGWESTRVQTQIAPRRPSDAGDDGDIGRAVDDRTRDLFVAVDPAEAMVQQFDHLRPEYVAVHDIGTSASRKLLAGIAAASKRPVQRLLFRRAGGGTTLATIEFFDCVAANRRPVRLYSTAVEGDTVVRQAMARVLLSRSSVGVVFVGDLPSHALATAFEPWHEAALRSDWPCRRMLFLPLGPGAALFDEVAKLRNATRIEATTMPPVTRPAEVWAHLCGAWNAMQTQSHPGEDPATLPLLVTTAAPAAPPSPAPATPSAAVAAAAPTPVRYTPPTPMPVVGRPVPTADEPLEHYLHQLSQLAGVLSACAFDVATGRPVGHAGARPGPDELGRHGSTMVNTMMSVSRMLGLGAAVPDASITLGQHHLVLRPLPGHPGMALHVVVDKTSSNLALVLLQLRRLDEALLAASRPAGAALNRPPSRGLEGSVHDPAEVEFSG